MLKLFETPVQSAIQMLLLLLLSVPLKNGIGLGLHRVGNHSFFSHWILMSKNTTFEGNGNPIANNMQITTDWNNGRRVNF